MVTIFFGFGLATVGLTALALQRFYSSVPTKELRRLAARGDHLAAKLYQAVAYGASLRLLLWIVVSSGLTGGVILLAQGLAAPAAFLSVGLILLAGLVFLQSAKLTVRTAAFAAAVAPAIGAVLARVEPVFGRLSHRAAQRRNFVVHSGLYEKEDLIDLLGQQKDQADNRISHEELELARRALHFGETQAADVMLSRKDMKSLKVDDSIGPILLEELHKSGQQAFVVYDDQGQAAGTLQMQDAVKAKSGGKVSELTNSELTYVHEDFTLRQTLDCLLKSGQQLALVINSFEEVAGVVSLPSLMQELLGQATGTEFAYQDRAAIAAYQRDTAKTPPADDEQPAESFPAAPSSDAPEVVK